MHSSTLYLTSALEGGCVVNATPRPLNPRERDRLPILQEAGWAPRVDLDGCGKSRPLFVFNSFVQLINKKGACGLLTPSSRLTALFCCLFTCRWSGA